MKKPILTFALFLLVSMTFTACSGDATNESNDTENATDQVDESSQDEEEVEEPAPVAEVSPLGNFSELVGEWTVDAATAGVKMDLTFGEDGSFTQIMGQVNGVGTWEVVDDEHIKIVTQNTKGQTWKITDITETSVNMCWNPDSADPKTIPMQRVQ